MLIYNSFHIEKERVEDDKMRKNAMYGLLGLPLNFRSWSLNVEQRVRHSFQAKLPLLDGFTVTDTIGNNQHKQKRIRDGSR